jgi:hypothetical protein
VNICGQLFGFDPRLGVTSRRRNHRAQGTTDFTDSHRLVATKTRRHEGVCSALAYSAEVILVPKGLRCPFASSAESRIIRASLYKPSKQNKTRKNTQLAKTGWLDTRFRLWRINLNTRGLENG